MSSYLERLALKKVRKRFPALKRCGFVVAVRQTCGSEFASIGRLEFLPDGWFVAALLFEHVSGLFPLALPTERRTRCGSGQACLKAVKAQQFTGSVVPVDIP